MLPFDLRSPCVSGGHRVCGHRVCGHRVCGHRFTVVPVSKKLSEFGFNRNAFRYSVRSVLIFFSVRFVLQMIASILLTRLNGLGASLAYPLNARNVTGSFLFELLLSGTSEEILFRAMIIPPMLVFFRAFLRRESVARGAAIAVAPLVINAGAHQL